MYFFNMLKIESFIMFVSYTKKVKACVLPAFSVKVEMIFALLKEIGEGPCCMVEFDY